MPACYLPQACRSPAARERYDKASRRAWRPGDNFRMLWEVPGAPELRVWYFGHVLRRMQRAPTDPMRDSPWEALQACPPRWAPCVTENCSKMLLAQPQRRTQFLLWDWAVPTRLTRRVSRPVTRCTT